MSNSKETLAHLVKTARLKKGISQRELSRRTGVDNNTLAKIERGLRKKPNIVSLKKLSDELDLDLDKLLDACGYDEISVDAANDIFNIYENVNKINNSNREDIAKKNLEKILYKLKEYHLIEDKLGSKDRFKEVLKTLPKEDKKAFEDAYKLFLDQYDWNIEDLRLRAKDFADIYTSAVEKDALFYEWEKENERWEKEKIENKKVCRKNPSIWFSLRLDENDD